VALFYYVVLVEVRRKIQPGAVYIIGRGMSILTAFSDNCGCSLWKSPQCENHYESSFNLMDFLTGPQEPL
jgi:hypothetical protein